MFNDVFLFLFFYQRFQLAGIKKWLLTPHKYFFSPVLLASKREARNWQEILSIAVNLGFI